MKFTNRQIDYMLNTARNNVRSAVIKDGNVFFGDVIMSHGTSYHTVSMTYRGMPVDLSADAQRHARALSVLRRAYRIRYNRIRMRSFIQRLSDKITQNYKLDEMSDLEISAWFALDKIAKNMETVKITKVGYMHNIKLGNITLSHLPRETAAERHFLMVVDDKFLEIHPVRSNRYLYARAASVFFTIYSERIYPKMRQEARKNTEKPR